jgi:uncharacterized membrane protein
MSVTKGGSSGSHASLARRVLLRAPILSLGAMLVVYVAITFWLSGLRFYELYTCNWDLGIFQQALWSSSHGHMLYEAGDYEMSGAASFFEIHPSLLTAALIPAYAWDPSPFLLMAIQSAVVAAAAVPLFVLARAVTGSARKAVLTAGLYLVFPPLLSANLDDFHLESFLPLEMFTLFLLLYRERYLLGTLVATLGMVTIEIGPVLVAAIAIYFLWPTLKQLAFPLLSRTSHRDAGGVEPREPVHIVRLFREAFHARRARYLAALLLLAGVGYVLLRFFQNDPSGLGLAPTAVSGNPPVSFTGGDIHVALGHFPIALAQKCVYWLLCYALVLFLPWRAPRTQIIALPWIGYTFFSSDTLTILGLQYGFITTIPLLLGVTFGLRDLELPVRRAERTTVTSESAHRQRPGAELDGTSPRLLNRPWPSPQSSLWTFLLIISIAACLLLTPLDPIMQTSTLGTNGYDVSYSIPPGFSQVQQLASEIPSSASVVTSNDLFPLVANDLHAYAFLWTPDSIPPFLPFNASHPPTFVFLASNQWFSVPTWLQAELSSGSAYSVLGQVPGTDQGTVTLFELSGG